MIVVLASGTPRARAQAALAEAERLDTQVEQLDKQRKFAEAVPLAEHSLSLREKQLGPRHPGVAASLTRLARMYRSLGEYKKAQPLLVRALGIREKALGRMDPVLAATLNDLGDLLLEQGAYAKAEPLLIRALEIREKVLGPMNRGVSETLNSLAGLYSELGAFAKAEPLMVRALEIDERALGPTHPDLAHSLNNLGMHYVAQGVLVKAEPLLVRALDIRERPLGAMPANVATSLNNLAMLYGIRGALGKAEPLYVRAIDIWEKALGAMHPNVAAARANLAALYAEQGAYAEAEPLFLRAIEIDQKALGMHPSVAKDLTSLAGIYRDQGAYARAEPLFLRAIEIWEKSVGPIHPGLAACLRSLAEVYTAQGAYAKAEPLFLRARRIDEKMLGTMHPEIARHLYALAGLHRAQGAHDRAQPLLARALEVREAQLRTELARLSEVRRRALMTTLRDETASVVSFHVDGKPTSASALELALTTVLRRKGRILDSLAETQATLRGHLTPGLRAQLDQLARARTELSERLYSPPNLRGLAERAAAVAASRARVEALEAALGTASLEFRAQSAPITVAKVQAALPRGAMLVEFVRYRSFAPSRAEQRLQPDRYVAYLLAPQGPPRWVALGDAAPIDAAVDAALAVLHRAPGAQASNAPLRTLDELVFAPVRAQLTDVTHVIVGPDGKLNLVPFEALVDPQGHYEVEQRLISYVTSGRDLLRLAALRAPRSPAVIVASPDYGPVPSPAVPGAVSFAPLAGTAAEVRELRRFFSAAPLTGAAATKRAFAALAGPAILHVATHGFYTRDAAATPPAPAGSGSTTQPVRGMVLKTAPRPQQPGDPLDDLDRAGLAMAGANQGAEGIVTAREIAGFDWWGTKLVVLSACETGVGAVPSGDGVYGLRRAVVLAGAEAQVVSLWNVNDSSAHELMREYYDDLFRGTGRAEAIRQAKLRLLRQPRYSHPHYWAAFILAGNWTPLDESVLQQRPIP